MPAKSNLFSLITSKCNQFWRLFEVEDLIKLRILINSSLQYRTVGISQWSSNKFPLTIGCKIHFILMFLNGCKQKYNAARYSHIHQLNTVLCWYLHWQDYDRLPDKALHFIYDTMKVFFSLLQWECDIRLSHR